MLNFGNKEFRNLQEQVLKNAQDIETLKGRQNLQVVIVEELPEVGNPDYIYLVPNNGEEELDVYEEYIWLEDEERYEQIGGVSIDLTKVVMTDTAQTISGVKTFSSGIITASVSSNGALALHSESGIETKGNVAPQETNTNDIGSSSKTYKDVYLSGKIDLGSSLTISKDSSNRMTLNNGADTIIKVGNINSTYCKANWTPDQNDTYNLGRQNSTWKDAYISGNISDGVNSVTVANISKKTTSTYASGTFDSSGQDTIDISGGTPEGLFIFSYGNCQCLVHLTATMVQNADLTPIRVSCPMISNSVAKNGWLAISRSGTTLTIEVVDDDSQEHVDSGYAWTLVKTGLI